MIIRELQLSWKRTMFVIINFIENLKIVANYSFILIELMQTMLFSALNILSYILVFSRATKKESERFFSNIQLYTLIFIN